MLVICPTPIGNLDDITRRQMDALRGADIIACEDTRRSGKLLELLGIERVEGRPKLWRYDDHTASEQVSELVGQIEAGNQVVLVSDAGTPTISDPGYLLVRECRRRGIEVCALPGAVAAMVALSASGLPTDRFHFEGFLPAASEKRRERLRQLDDLGVTFVTYESPRRIVDTLKEIEQELGAQRQVCVGRELTKRHEEYLVASAASVSQELASRSSIRGEVVLCVGPKVREGQGGQKRWQEVDRSIRILAGQQLRSRTIKEIIDEMYDVPRSQIYDRIEKVMGDNS